MRVLGLDVGDKTIGVAISDEMRWTAQAFEVIQRKGLSRDIERIKEILSEYQVKEIIIGLPKNMNGEEGPQAKKVREFLKKLQAQVDLPIKTWDERLTTTAAERTLLEGDLSRAKRKKIIDKVAAQVILQGYLDSIGTHSLVSPVDK
ncbi:MAG: Holliday junction resolvase RuvX [Nitrospirae bacterium]|nr:Holliday junction resolvase RuvX [Nitrospirota bacterium]